MSCNDYFIRIGPYVDGELPRGEREEVEEHIERCSNCRRMATEFTTLDRIAGRGHPPRVSATEWAETLSMVRQKAREGSWPGPAWNRGRLTAAVSLAAAALLAVFLVVGNRSDPVIEQRSDSPIAGPEKTAETDPTEPRVAEGPEEDTEELSPEETSETTGESSRF